MVSAPCASTVASASRTPSSQNETAASGAKPESTASTVSPARTESAPSVNAGSVSGAQTPRSSSGRASGACPACGAVVPYTAISATAANGVPEIDEVAVTRTYRAVVAAKSTSCHSATFFHSPAATSVKVCPSVETATWKPLMGPFWFAPRRR